MIQLKSNQPGYFEIFKGAGDSGWYFACNCPCGCPYMDVVLLHKHGDPPINPIHTHWEWEGDSIVQQFQQYSAKLALEGSLRGHFMKTVETIELLKRVRD